MDTINVVLVITDPDQFLDASGKPDTAFLDKLREKYPIIINYETFKKMLNAQQARLKSTESVIANLPGSLPDLVRSEIHAQAGVDIPLDHITPINIDRFKTIVSRILDNLAPTDLRPGAAKLDYIDYRNKILVVLEKV